jgi:hypothetical protein
MLINRESPELLRVKGLAMGNSISAHPLALKKAAKIMTTPDRSNYIKLSF